MFKTIAIVGGVIVAVALVAFIGISIWTVLFDNPGTA
jgi:hypothetical protein